MPISFLAYRYNYRIAWFALLLVILGNGFMTVWASAVRYIPFVEIVWDLMYFAATAFIFTLVCSPPDYVSEKVSGAVRFITGSCLGAFLFTGIFHRASASPGFVEYVNSMMKALVSAYQATGSDVVQNALIGSLTGEVVLNAMKSIMLRGGSLISCMFLFYVSRQLGLFLVRLVFRIRGMDFPKSKSFVVFHVSPVIIWVLSVSLFLVVMARMAKLEIPEIFLWNILILCIILYLAQGLGIVQFFLAKPSMLPFLRFFLITLFIILIFSPVVNAVILAGIILLGIAENWVPFRAPKPNGPPSTPEAGDAGN